MFFENLIDKMTFLIEHNSVLEYLKDHFVNVTLLVVVLYLLYRVIDWKYWFAKNLPPGPIGLPIVGYIPFLGSEPHKTLAKLREKYGDIIGLKIGMNYMVVLNEYNVMKEVLSHPASYDRPKGFFGDLKLGFAEANGEVWSEQRRYVIHSMRNLGLGRSPWEILTKESTSDLIEDIRTYNGKPVEINEKVQCALSNNIISLLYGRRFHPVTEKDKIQTVAKFSDFSFKHIGPTLPSSVIPGFQKFCEYLRIGDYKEAAMAKDGFLDISKKEIEKHWIQEDYQGLEDFTNLYKQKSKQVQSQSERQFYTDENLLENATALFVGSSDTVSTSLDWLFRIMAAHLDVQEKVHDELDTIIGKDGSINYEERTKIPYTLAVILEAERWSSFVPLSGTRRARDNFEIRGFMIPKGAFITGNLWAMHHDPNYWEDPERFQPERFLTQNKKELVKNKASFGPFSFGKRSCPGETIASIAMLSVFTAMMQKFEIRPPPGEEVRFDYVGQLVLHLKSQPLRLIERL